MRKQKTPSIFMKYLEYYVNIYMPEARGLSKNTINSYKTTFEAGSLSWPRTTQEAAELTKEQFNYLMLGLNPLDPKIKEIHPKQAQ